MDYTDKINATNAKNSFMLHNGIRLTAMEKDYAMFLTMADCASGGAARSNGMRYVTVSSSFEFYRNTENDHLIAEARIKNRGRTICVAEVEIHDGLGKLLCGGTFTLYCVGADELSEKRWHIDP